MDSRWSKDWLTGSFGLLHCLSVESRCCSSPFAPHPQTLIPMHTNRMNECKFICFLGLFRQSLTDWLTGAHNRIVLHSALHPSILCPPHSETVGATQANNVVLFPAPGVGLFSGYIGQNILCWAEEEQQQKERKQLTHSPLYRTEIGKWVSQSEREKEWWRTTGFIGETEFGFPKWNQQEWFLPLKLTRWVPRDTLNN